MTKQSEILEDSKYKPVLDHGFVGLVDSMGNDQSIVNSARVSYGAGTRKVNEDRGLIRYLLRHYHTTPFEMVEFKFHIKLPIFVMRQHIRHRTANVNEYSARYSILTDEFYFPEYNHFSQQSTSNNQGRADDPVDKDYYLKAREDFEKIYKDSYDMYQYYINDSETRDDNRLPIPEDGDRPMIAREISRMILPTAGYTECYWKTDLHNLMHYLTLRMDSHAQYEIRVFAQAMYELVKPICPVALEAFEDYRLNAERFSGPEMEILRMYFKTWDVNPEKLEEELFEKTKNRREAKELVAKLFKNK